MSVVKRDEIIMNHLKNPSDSSLKLFIRHILDIVIINKYFNRISDFCWRQSRTSTERGVFWREQTHEEREMPGSCSEGQTSFGARQISPEVLLVRRGILLLNEQRILQYILSTSTYIYIYIHHIHRNFLIGMIYIFCEDIYISRC